MIPAAPIATASHVIAVTCMVAEMLLATVSNVLLRVAAMDLDPEVTLFLRLTIATLIMLPLLASSRSSLQSTLSALADRRRIVRYVLCGLVSYLASIAWLYALLRLPLAMATSLFFTTALFMGAMGRWFLSEAFSQRNWISILIGSVGVAVVLRPSFESVSMQGVAAALAAAALAALGKAELKRLSGPETPLMSAFLRLAPVLPFAVLPTLGAWTVPSPASFVAIALAALLLVAGHAAIARGYALASLTQASALEYLRLLFATAAGIIVFGESAGSATLIGGAIILGAALLGARARPKVRLARTLQGSLVDLTTERGHRGT